MLKVEILSHPTVQLLSATHKSLHPVLARDTDVFGGEETYAEPVSNMTLYETAGVPIASEP